MSESAPEALGFERGEALPAIGRAKRFRCEAGERWEFADAALATRLLALGDQGVGGFVARDPAGPEGEAWLIRRPPTHALSRWIEQRPSKVVPHDVALRLAVSLARALEACERAALFPGPVWPSALMLDEEGDLWLPADGLVAALVGAPRAAAATQTSPARWLPVEQANGAAWDNAANRYVVGLLLYRLLSGEHPFAAKGLRLGLEEQAGRGAPPFPAAIADALPPGLQSCVLRLIDPRPERRPATAKALRRELEELAQGGRRTARKPQPRVRVPEAKRTNPAPVAAPPPPRRPPTQGLAVGGACLVGLLAGGLVLGMVEAPERSGVPVGERAPLGADDLMAESCVSCHPRQGAEWRRSVMAHSARSPLFQALEILIEEQVGRSQSCEHGAGVLRRATSFSACRNDASGLPITGSGGEHWCVNCHAPNENLRPSMPAWDGQSSRSNSRLPLTDLLSESSMEGIGCAFCHQTHGPVRPGDLAGGRYEGNPFWTSSLTGERFSMRPEDRRGLSGISNSGYSLDPRELISASTIAPETQATLAGGAHLRPSEAAASYLRSSEFCGACHDVRLFGTDGLRGSASEPFMRLRNAYSEWSAWATLERAGGREPASCQDCHMSLYPGVCVADESEADADGSPATGLLDRACPTGTHFEARAPGSYADAFTSISSNRATPSSSHYFSGVDVPLSPDFPDAFVQDSSTDVQGIPLGARERRDLLLAGTFRFEVGEGSFERGRLQLPVTIENVGAGHRVPAGFSQEREFWVHLRVTDASGAVVYEVGRVERGDEDLHDKVFLRVQTDDRVLDFNGQPIGLFGADVADGPDVPRWSAIVPGREFRGQGLINLQNGFLRCVQCIGVIDALGRCQPTFGQGRIRSDRYADGAFDPTTGVCTSNLIGEHAFFETYLPVGSLDSTRGTIRGPDAIMDDRSAPPGVPLLYRYDLQVGARPGPLRVTARLLFRSFPPFLIRAFAAYERNRALAGARPSGPLVTNEMLERLDVVELGRVETTIE